MVTCVVCLLPATAGYTVQWERSVVRRPCWRQWTSCTIKPERVKANLWLNYSRGILLCDHWLNCWQPNLWQPNLYSSLPILSVHEITFGKSTGRERKQSYVDRQGYLTVFMLALPGQYGNRKACGKQMLPCGLPVSKKPRPESGWETDRFWFW